MAKAGRWEPKSGRTPSKDIVVDQVRDLVDHRLSMKRFEGRRRFVIVDPADAMNPQAQNALLKTLEEPPEDTTLVLVASSPDALLPTIRSRCLRVPFAPIPAAVVAARLEAEGHPPEKARLAAALSGGSLGRALAVDDDALAAQAEAVRARRVARRRTTRARGSRSPASTAGIARTRRRCATCSSSGCATSPRRRPARPSSPSPTSRARPAARPARSPRRRCSAAGARSAGPPPRSGRTARRCSRSRACSSGGSMAAPRGGRVRGGDPRDLPRRRAGRDAAARLPVRRRRVPRAARGAGARARAGAGGAARAQPRRARRGRVSRRGRGQEVATGGLFGGGKVVLVQEPAFLTSKEDVEASFETARKAWGEGRQRDATRRLLALVAKGGWSAADLDPPDRDEKANEKLAREFKREFGFEPDVAFLRAAGRFAAERDMKAAKDDSSALDAALERGFPPGHVLVVAAGKVDGRLPLVKKLAGGGTPRDDPAREGREVGRPAPRARPRARRAARRERQARGPRGGGPPRGARRRRRAAARVGGREARRLRRRPEGHRREGRGRGGDARRVRPVLRARERRGGPRPRGLARGPRPRGRGRRVAVHAARVARGDAAPDDCGARAGPEGRGREEDRLRARLGGDGVPDHPGRRGRRQEAVRLLDEVPGGDALLARGAARRPRPAWPRRTWP